MDEQPKTFKLSSAPDKDYHKRVLLYGLGALFLIVIGGSVGYMFATNNTQPQIAPVAVVLSPTPETTANWKTFTSKDSLYQIVIPSNWTITYSGGSPEFVSDNKALLQIITWNYSDLATIKQEWQSPICEGSDPNSGCITLPNKEVSQRVINGYDVYIKVDNNASMYAFIPNTAKNKTIEIDSILLTDKKVFNQILSTFKFTDQNLSTIIPSTIPSDSQNRPPPPPGVTEVSPNPRSM